MLDAASLSSDVCSLLFLIEEARDRSDLILEVDKASMSCVLFVVLKKPGSIRMFKCFIAN